MSQKPIRSQFADTMLDVGQKDPRLVVLLGDISHFIMQPFAKACPGRFYNVGICEPAIVGMAAGLAKVGLVPVAHTIAPFLLERSLEQIKINFSYHRLAGNLITVGSAFDYGNLGCTHHCYNDAALIKNLQNSEVIFPATALEFDALFKQTYDNSKLTLFRLPGTSHGLDFAESDVKAGKGIKIFEGKDLSIIVTGPQLQAAVEVREQLLGEGLSTEIIYLHTLKPLDEDLIRASVAKTKKVLVVEEHRRVGGLGMDVLYATRGLGNVTYSFAHLPEDFITRYDRYPQHCAVLKLDREGLLTKIRGELIANA